MNISGIYADNNAVPRKGISENNLLLNGVYLNGNKEEKLKHSLHSKAV